MTCDAVLNAILIGLSIIAAVVVLGFFTLCFVLGLAQLSDRRRLSTGSITEEERDESL